MDDIRIGLDFGTHQTKICIQRTPDEGHGIPEYEFFQFTDRNGKDQYFLPSIVQINKNDTLSFGYVSPEDEKEGLPKPRFNIIRPTENPNFDTEANALYEKYSCEKYVDQDGLSALKEMLKQKYERDVRYYDENIAKAQSKYDEELAAYNKESNLFRYFKQASFAKYPWVSKYSSDILCVWYLAYVLFLLEDRYPDGFAINMGVPTDDKTFNQKRELGTRILISAINLVEDEFHNDLREFLNTKVTDLEEKTVIVPFSEDDKFDYRINVFPEAYASLIGLTSRGKLSNGMSINADIGGGTTDISFFMVQDKMPQIYKYWSIPIGLNYIAEKSGYHYSEKDFIKNAHKEVIDKFNHKKAEIIYNLISELIIKVRENGIDKSNLLAALKDRILVYNGGGSVYPDISTAIYLFSDVKIADADLWSEEIVKDEKKVGKYFNLLTTAYGLSVSEEDSEVVLCDYENIFSSIGNNVDYEKKEIDKDVC